ncbi:MAG TPA: 2OG-Fe(II) oxygenase [Kofleriaceae bacterium]|jgi:predicted 2-oxoglutarate/Fe(II)-dependent dioxygenase YbiX
MQPVSVLVPGSNRPYLDGDSLDHSGPLVWSVPNVLSAAECSALIERIEAQGPTDAPVSTSSGMVMMPDVRNNKRVMFDDVALAARVYERIAQTLPTPLHGAKPLAANERFRCYRYEPGQRFAPHYDGSFQRSATERSELTLMVYLNDDFSGGATAFHDFGSTATPRTGMALLFQHRLLHEGCVVTRGVKYVLRSDVMYRAL